MGAGPLVIVVCTKGRPNLLARLLSSLAVQEWPAAVDLLVLDNDAAQSAQPVVKAALSDFPVAIQYSTEARAGYATVRNAALDVIPSGAAVCFIDDDAVVPHGWLRTMFEAHGRSPQSIIRSRYLHVATLPPTTDELADLLVGVDMAALGPAGTSGLLLPAGAHQEVRFDPYFDRSGAEDMDLLARLDALGHPELLADAVVIEQDRVQSLTPAQQRAIARWNGRLSTIARAHRGCPTLGWRIGAAARSVWALLQAVARFALGRRDAGHSYMSYSASRWAMAAAPIRPPNELGGRPWT
ncbi:MAG: glycosyltransferase family A protein [Candidatus Nanopelagicales bacterium]|nr:glycosyltransferase family A protein [Candidatus Nanopelagicales bacterium]